MAAAQDAINLCRAYLAGDDTEADRILTASPNHAALAAACACIFARVGRHLSGPTLEAVFAEAKAFMRDIVLDGGETGQPG